MKKHKYNSNIKHTQIQYSKEFMQIAETGNSFHILIIKCIHNIFKIQMDYVEWKEMREDKFYKLKFWSVQNLMSIRDVVSL